VPAPSRSFLPFKTLIFPITAFLGLFSWVATRTTASDDGGHPDVEHNAGNDAQHGRKHGRLSNGLPRNVQRKFTVGRKYYPLVAGESELNLPLAILRRLSEWIALLETRGSTGGVFGTFGFRENNVTDGLDAGATIGGMMGCLASFEDQLSGLERILTTPLPL
jgi:hypothetical protein